MTNAQLVIGGHRSPLPKRSGGNRFAAVHRSMALVIARNYPGAPDVRTMTASQIRLFYDALAPELEGTD
jgi:hypothetical protein